MSLPRLRRRADLPTFAAWCAQLPELVLPDLAPPDLAPPEWWFEQGASGGDRMVATTRGATVPPLVAAALGVASDPRATVLFAVRDETSITTGRVALGADVLSSLVRSSPIRYRPGDRSAVQSRPGDRSAWVEVALLPARRAVTEVLRWVPVRPRGDASFEVRVPEPDAGAAWVQRWTATGGHGWQLQAPGVGPPDVAALSARLEALLDRRVVGDGALPEFAVREAG